MTTVTGAPCASPHPKDVNESSSGLDSFDFGRMDDHSSKLDVTTSLIDTAIDEIPAGDESTHRSQKLLFAALWMLNEQCDLFIQMHRDLHSIKRAEASHA